MEKTITLTNSEVALIKTWANTHYSGFSRGSTANGIITKLDSAPYEPVDDFHAPSVNWPENTPTTIAAERLLCQCDGCVEARSNAPVTLSDVIKRLVGMLNATGAITTSERNVLMNELRNL